jgi:hypothetical protein
VRELLMGRKPECSEAHGCVRAATCRRLGDEQ